MKAESSRLASSIGDIIATDIVKVDSSTLASSIYRGGPSSRHCGG